MYVMNIYFSATPHVHADTGLHCRYHTHDLGEVFLTITCDNSIREGN